MCIVVKKGKKMDREFMKSFLNNYYADFQREAVKESEEYKEKRNKRYEIERAFELGLQEYKELSELFEAYLDACADELEVLLEQMYLLGAADREKMLRGII